MGSFNDEYLKLRKKRLEDEEKGQPREILTPYRRPLASDVTNEIKTDGGGGDIAPVAYEELERSRLTKRLHALAKNSTDPMAEEETEERTWFKKSGLWDDGYQFGDVTKTILAGGQDLIENIGAGIAEMPEKALDALLTIAPYVAQGQYYANGGGYNLQADAIANQAFEAGKKGNAEIVKKDLYSGEDVAKFILTEHNPVSYDNFTGRSSEEDSVLGEKTDELAQSGGQLLGTAALQAVGVPAWLTIGATAMGGEAENALNNGATLEEAAASGLISAGAEILTEKISGGIDFGMGTLDDGLSSALAANISNKTLQTLTKLGVDMAGEGAEEVFSGAISAVGQKLTYADDKELNELFSSEDAFEAFIGGAVLGGVGSGGKAVVNTVKGNDAVTGLQKDTEQKVVDKLYEEALADAETDGKKLTLKDKTKLYNGVLNNLEKGYISTDVIEEVLGGEDYKTYQSEIKRQQDLDNELNELRNMKSSEMTDIQTERMAELKAMKPNTEMVNALKFGIDEKIHNSIKDTKLVESYNEKARRGEAFKADLSKYDSKQAAVVQKAIDSGILNNTNRTHEFVDMVSKISADKGVLFDFTDNAKLKESGFSLDGKTINGYVTKDGVTLNVNSAKSLNSVVGHEIAHVLEGTELYAELSGAIVEYSKSKGDYQSRYDALKNLYKDVADADIDAELTADLVGDYLFTDENFVNKLSVQNKNVFKKLWDEIEYLYNLATAGSKEKRDLERVKKVFEKAYKQSGKASGDTKNSTKYSLALDNQENLVYNGTRGDTHARTDEFRKLQEASQRMSDEDIQLYHSGNKSLDDLVRRRFSRGVKSIFLESENNGVGYAKGLLNLTAKNNSFNIYEGVNASLFHDVFEMARNHLKYGELVDLHTVETTEDGIGYNDCYNYLSEDGLSGFSITPDGDLISVFNASGKSGFLRAIAPIVKEKAKTLDCYASENQNLMEIYSSIFGFKTASVMDYNMEYDHDNIAENHGMPQIAFMVNSASDVETKSFTKDEYDEAVTYRNSFVNQATDNEIAPIKEASSTDDVFFDGKNPKYSLSEYTAEEKKAHNDAVKNHFGKTYKWAETGYLLLDGTQLDLSGKHDGAPGGYRTVDHRDITEALGYDYGGGEYSDSLIQFMSEGNIRIIPECNGINLSVKPTKAQEQALSNYITRYRGEVLLDIDDLNGNTVVSVEYPYGTYYTKVLNDIREWFENGKKPENSSGYSLTKQGDTPKRYGSYNVYGKDIGLDRGNIAPMREDISKVENTHEGIAPMVDKAVDKAVDERVPEGFAPMEHSAMYESEVERVNAEMDRLAEEASRLYSEGKVDEAQVIIEQMQALNESGKDTRDKYYALKSQENADTEGYLNSLTDADAPPEIEAPYYEDGGIIDPFDEREYSQVGNQKVKSYMTENPEVKPYFQAEAERLLQEYQSGEKAHSIYNGWQKYEMTYDAAQDIPEIYRVKRDMSPSIAYLRDNVKMSYDDIEKGLKAIIEGNDNINTAAAKKVEVMLHDRLMNGYTDASGYPIPANQEYRDLIKSQGVLEGREEAFKQLIKDTNKVERAQMKDIAPLPTFDTASEKQIPGQQTIFEEAPIKDAPAKNTAAESTKEEPKIAKVLTEEPKTDTKKRGIWSMFKNNVLDKGMIFEDISLKTGNRELQAKWNSIRYAKSRAQQHIGKGEHSLNSIRETVEKSGKTQGFYDYLYHLHNVDRMSLEGKAELTRGALQSKFGHLKPEQIKAIALTEITDKTTERTANTIREARQYLNALDTKNKPVFAEEVTADMSKATAAELEKANPEFKQWAQEVYDYMNDLRTMLVDEGVISQETADLWAKIYPHYVPIRRAGKDGPAINVALDTNRTGINAPIKRATGGNSDILPLFDTMALRTEQTYRAIAKNRFGVELKNTLGTTIDRGDMSLDDAIDNLDNDEGLLKEGKNGANPTFTVFENGERVEFEITEEMYDAIKPTGKGLSYTNKVANTVGNVFRGLLTEYNPVFMATNAVKDAQDVLINSQHAGKTYANIPVAIKEMATKGHWYKEYIANGGEQNTYFDSDSATFKETDKGIKKIVGMPLRAISAVNNTIERLPRLAEYIASRKSGASVDVSMLDAARVTTNFAAGGDLTKALNRNGFTFLNASTQGAIQQVRNVREAKANGLKGWLQLATKTAIAGIPALILNDLLWDDDEEYEELSDYVKQNYYVVAKFGDGKFVRIPKGRTVAVIQDAFEQINNARTGDDEVDMQSFFELAISNLAPNNPLENNIIAPIIQVKNNKTWYGEDLVPSRLQDLPDAEQYDESTDSISKWLGEKLDYSPYKINYLLNQYSGGIGDVALPMLTPESDGSGVLAPFADKFTTDSTMKNQNVSDFYDTVDELTKNANSANATDEDILKNKYMNTIRTELSVLYTQKREIQNSDLTDKEKDEAVREIQEQINAKAKEALETYGEVNIDGNYATVGDLHYRWYEPSTDSEGEPHWEKITDKQLAQQDKVTKRLDITPSEYWGNKEEYDFAYESPGKYEIAKAIGGYGSYKMYTKSLNGVKGVDEDGDGKSDPGTKKEKVINWINSMEDLDYGQKIILYRSMYNSKQDREDYNYDIIDYLNSRDDINYAQMKAILEELGMTVDSEGYIYWD